jgi:hypothetical protein
MIYFTNRRNGSFEWTGQQWIYFLSKKIEIKGKEDLLIISKSLSRQMKRTRYNRSKEGWFGREGRSRRCRRGKGLGGQPESLLLFHHIFVLNTAID